MNRRPISLAESAFVPINRRFEPTCSRFQVSLSFLFFLMTSRAKQSEVQSDNAKQISLCCFQGVWRSAGSAFGVYRVHSHHRNANIRRLEGWRIGRVERWRAPPNLPAFHSFTPVFSVSLW